MKTVWIFTSIFFCTLLICCTPNNSKEGNSNLQGSELTGLLFENPDNLIKNLSLNGIGELSEWKNPFDMGWGSLTPYYQFGTTNNNNGMKNNISYYLEGSEKKCERISLVMNVNNPQEKKESQIFFKSISEKTLKTLNINVTDEFLKGILNFSELNTQTELYKIQLKLERSKIETYKLIIELL